MSRQRAYIARTSKNTVSELGKQLKRVGNVMTSENDQFFTSSNVPSSGQWSEDMGIRLDVHIITEAWIL